MTSPDSSPATPMSSAEDADVEDLIRMYHSQITAGVAVESRPRKETETGTLLEEYDSAERDGKLEVLAELIYRVEESQVRERLESCLGSDDQQIVVLAMIGLSQQENGRAVETIIDQLEDPPMPEIIVPGINILERLDPGSHVIEPLVCLLRHDWDEVKFHAAMALSRLDGLSDETLVENLHSLLDGDVDESTLYYTVLLLKEREVESGIPLLEELLDHEVIGYFAIEALGVVNGEQSLELVEPYLEDDDPIRQYYAAEAIGNIGLEDCWDKLADLARNHKDRNVRYYSMRALHQIDPEDSIEVLLDRLQDDDPEIRNFASQSLIEFGDVVIKPYREALDSDDREAVVEALQVLGEIGDEDVMGDLLDKAYSADKEVEHAALEALQKMARDSEECRQWLLQQLPESEANLKINILRILEGLGNSELCSYLSRYLTADNTKLRYYTVGVCSGQDNPECLHLLGRLCQDDNLQVATYAVRTLTSISSREAREMSVELIEEEIRPLVLIAYLRGFFLHRDPLYEPAVVDLLKSTDDRRLRYYAGAALKAINQHRLEQMAEHDDYLQTILDRVRVT
jgi:HEAT repeat protein